MNISYRVKVKRLCRLSLFSVFVIALIMISTTDSVAAERVINRSDSLRALTRAKYSNARLRALALFEKGKKAESEGRYKKALEDYDRAKVKTNKLAAGHGRAVLLEAIRTRQIYYNKPELAGKMKSFTNRNKARAYTLLKDGEGQLREEEYEKAIRTLEDSLLIYRILNSRLMIASAMSNIGDALFSLGRFDDALNNYINAFEINEEMKVSKSIAENLNGIGECLYSLGKYDEAVKSFKDALEINKSIEAIEGTAINLSNMGRVSMSLGQYGEAQTGYEGALRRFKELKDSKGIAEASINLGILLYLEKEDKSKIEAHLKTAMRELDKVGRAGIGNFKLAELFIATRRFDDAREELRKLRPGLHSTNPDRVMYHTQMGLAMYGLKNGKESAKEFLKAVKLIEGLRAESYDKAGFLSVGGHSGRIRPYKELISILSEMATHNKDINSAEFNKYGKDTLSAAFYFAEAIKARALLESMASSSRGIGRAVIPVELRALKRDERKYRVMLRRVETRLEASRDKRAYRKALNERDVIKDNMEGLIEEIRELNPRYASKHYPRPMQPEELTIKENEVLLEYAITEEATYLFILKHNNQRGLVKIEAGRDELENRVAAFIKPLQSLYDIEDFSPDEGEVLYNLLISKALNEYIEDDKKINRIIIVPDGVLGLLPFEMLVTSNRDDIEDSDYFGDKWKITYSQSATVFALNRQLNTRNALNKGKRPLLALGNPIYSKDDPRFLVYKKGKLLPKQSNYAANLSRGAFMTRSSPTVRGGVQGERSGKIAFQPLPETDAEVRAIARLFDVEPVPQDVLLFINANETTLRKSPLSEYRYLHFATHADLPGNIEGINEPFLLLGQVENDKSDDGFLTMSEVMGLKLGAELAVLSACVTGRGEMIGGEGLANFARAFQHAGVSSVVVSLWSVDSAVTVEYMLSFYKYLKEYNDTATALRLAREGIKDKYPNPYYWAPFIMYGGV